MQPVVATSAIGVWENIKQYAKEPKIWAVISLAGVIAGLILKIHAIAALSIYVFASSLISLYARHQDTKALEEVVQEQADYNQWLARLEGILSPRGVIQNREDIELPADPQAFLDCVYAGSLFRLTHHHMDFRFQCDCFRGFLAIPNRSIEVNRMIQNEIFLVYQKARRQALDYQEKKERYETDIQQGMRWY